MENYLDKDEEESEWMEYAKKKAIENRKMLEKLGSERLMTYKVLKLDDAGKTHKYKPLFKRKIKNLDTIEKTLPPLTGTEITHKRKFSSQSKAYAEEENSEYVKPPISKEEKKMDEKQEEKDKTEDISEVDLCLAKSQVEYLDILQELLHFQEKFKKTYSIKARLDKIKSLNANTGILKEKKQNSINQSKQLLSELHYSLRKMKEIKESFQQNDNNSKEIANALYS